MSQARVIGKLVLVVASVLGATGCSSIPAGGDPSVRAEVRALAARGVPRLGKLAVAPVTTIALAADEVSKGWRTGETTAIVPGNVRDDVARACDASAAFDRVRSSPDDTLADAWSERDDLVARVSIENLRTHYDGRNGMWIPNMFIWFMWIVPSWWVATEEYSLTLDAQVTLLSAETGRELGRRTIPVKASGTFDEFDRGWQLFGFIYASLDAESWRRVAERLFPAAQREVAVAVARTLDELSRGVVPQVASEARRKTLVLSVGVSRYEDSTALPPLPFASEDARTVASAGLARGRPEHALVLVDGDATLPRVRAAFAEHLGRAREGDAVLVYFAGYGTRRQDGRAELLLHEADAKGDRGKLLLDEVASLLRGVAGAKLLVVDAAFSGRDRSVAGGGASGDDLQALAAVPSLATILACGPDEPALAPSHLGAGLLTFHLAQGLRGAGDEDRDGRIEASEVYRYARKWVVAESALQGHVQTPRAIGLDRGWVLH